MGGCAARGREPVYPSIVRSVSIAVPKFDDQKNLESYYLFWLDNTARSPEFLESHEELRSIINYLKIFESNKECEKAFEKITNGKIFLITNCHQGSLLLPI